MNDRLNNILDTIMNSNLNKSIAIDMAVENNKDISELFLRLFILSRI